MSDLRVKEGYQHPKIRRIETKCPCTFHHGGDATVSNSQNRLRKFGRRLVDHDAVVTDSLQKTRNS